MPVNQLITHFGWYSCFHCALQGDRDAEGAGGYYQSDPVRVALYALESFYRCTQSFTSAYFAFLDNHEVVERFQSGIDTARLQIRQQLEFGSQIGFRTDNIDQKLEKILRGLTVSTIAIALEFFEELMQRDTPGNVLRSFAQKIQTKEDLENLIAKLEEKDPDLSPSVKYIRDLEIEQIESCRDVLNRIIPIAIAIVKEYPSPDCVLISCSSHIENGRMYALRKILIIGGVAKLIFDHLIAIRDVPR